MDRRKSLKALAMSVVVPGVLLDQNGIASAAEKKSGSKRTAEATVAAGFASAWHEWPDMPWVGPEYWGNRLQDWRIQDGKLACLVRNSNRTLHCLTTQLSAKPEAFETSVTLQFSQNNKADEAASNYAGFRLGARDLNRFDDYRCAAVFGQGLDAGLTTAGTLFIGENRSKKQIASKEEVRLIIRAKPIMDDFQLTLIAINPRSNKPIDELSATVAAKSLIGNMALVQHYDRPENTDLGINAAGQPLNSTGGETEESGSKATVLFSDWQISGPKISHNPGQVFGPICFAQYTLHQKTLKLTAQLAPIENIPGHTVALQLKRNNTWENIKGTIDPMGRSVPFRVNNWTAAEAVPYRLKVDLPLKSGQRREYFYEGTIAAEPVNQEALKVAVFSCNADFGFPDAEIAPHVAVHQPDLAVFLGDQFYESSGGFRIQTHPLPEACLDYLRKWYMFGWSYRDIFRHIPCAIIPDDHDVYHGNLWGEAGKHASTAEDWGSPAQDQGGYKMPAEWVNMVHRTQTGHLPDAYDPTPVKQGIRVYYTNWNYGGISFAILEDRKFKSAPKNVLPPAAKVVNGFIQNPTEFDIKQHRDIQADLLGERQLAFLQHWATDWQDGTQMKAVLSQTNFCTIDTLPAGSTTDSITGKLAIPQPGEYVQGDAPTGNMDSNGWPQKGRDEALKAIRKCFAFHIAGDQHLASMVHYGVDAFGDSGFVFAGPALNNLHARRWWPAPNNQPLPGQPVYTGNFRDGFGNRVTVHAVANPQKTDLKPANVYDRATGYGIVTFNKAQRTIKTECWPRFINPSQKPDGQYAGWPITINQEDNYSRPAVAWLPEIKIGNLKNPVVEIVDENTNELVYALRIKGNRFKPKVFAKGTYSVRVREPETALVKEWKGVKAAVKNKRSIRLS
ncbi:hypothetical protein AAE02nite_41350 [Adhaeribacter aerolatus]|uniref:PhoD-like phosphatase metallophosphatase domain-containing protein n=1 Tax=Adhaeribacter aerolatus TaxID=670289 RepID=A0A512B3E5_9BACT|nr:alkaline phosphatase D family protein [Adhaeribacter aerolatus]GEO06471.1 hypothetical protein AAE02nite_41350 [Adhaeribacter aerolatus]